MTVLEKGVLNPCERGIEITFDGYGHLFPDANREAARSLDATLFGPRGKAEATRG